MDDPSLRQQQPVRPSRPTSSCGRSAGTPTGVCQRVLTERSSEPQVKREFVVSSVSHGPSQGRDLSSWTVFFCLLYSNTKQMKFPIFFQLLYSHFRKKKQMNFPPQNVIFPWYTWTTIPFSRTEKTVPASTCNSIKVRHNLRVLWQLKWN